MADKHNTASQAWSTYCWLLTYKKLSRMDMSRHRWALTLHTWHLVKKKKIIKRKKTNRETCFVETDGLCEVLWPLLSKVPTLYAKFSHTQCRTNCLLAFQNAPHVSYVDTYPSLYSKALALMTTCFQRLLFRAQTVKFTQKVRCEERPPVLYLHQGRRSFWRCFTV